MLRRDGDALTRRAVTALVAASLAWPWLGVAAPPEAAPAAAKHLEFPVKPTGPIAVEYRRATEPTVGVPLGIAVTARVEGSVGGLNIEATPTLPRAVLVTPPTLVEADERGYSWDITIVPLAADAGYLSIIVSGTIDGIEQARSVTIPLGSAVAPGATSDAVASDEVLIALPVEESP